MKDALITLNESRRALEAELEKITARAEKIRAALNSISTNNGHIRSSARPSVRNKQGLEAQVIEVLRKGPLTKKEILQAVLHRGYRFSTTDPMKSLNALLYPKMSRFSHQDGKFRVKAGR